MDIRLVNDGSFALSEKRLETYIQGTKAGYTQSFVLLVVLCCCCCSFTWESESSIESSI